MLPEAGWEGDRGGTSLDRDKSRDSNQSVTRLCSRQDTIRLARVGHIDCGLPERRVHDLVPRWLAWQPTENASSMDDTAVQPNKQQ